MTAALPGTGGTLRESPEDFEVEEIPAYVPCGTGEHLFVWIEKRGVSAEQLLEHVAWTLGVGREEVGCAGLKDRHAVTRQFLSVPRSAEIRLAELDTESIRVLDAQAHTNKLRTGHLRGNRFRIVVRNVVADAMSRAAPIVGRLKREGLANYFGPQRFGRDASTAQLGMQLLRGEVDRVPGPPARLRFLRKLALSAGQAVLFNRYLARRLSDSLLRTALDGDVMFKQSGGIFYVTDVAAEQARFDARETVHAGPIFGKKTFAARGEAARREEAILAEAGIHLERLAAFGALLAGTRRENLVYLDDLAVEATSEGLGIRFSLPAGSYATVLLRELMKSDEPALT